MRLISGLATLAGHYDSFLIDLWGVLHDGAAPYPGAIESLAQLGTLDKRVVLLSNAPRPSRYVAQRLEELGFAKSLYDALMTSGQLTWQFLHDRPDSWSANLGQRCYLLGPDRDLSLLEGLALERVDRIAQADFILNTGTDFGEGLERYETLLLKAAHRHLPMICANPDLTVVHRGRHEICAGTLAAHYERLGGIVRFLGKPYREIYDACFSLLPHGPGQARILAIGDSLRTDIAGANAVGIDSLFVTGGIHAKELEGSSAAPPAAETLAALYDKFGQRPSYAIARFIWS